VNDCRNEEIINGQGKAKGRTLKKHSPPQKKSVDLVGN
jgi:hypothetical protein